MMNLAGRGRLGSRCRRATRALMLRLAAHIQRGSLEVTLPEGDTRVFGVPGAAPGAAIRVLNNALFERLLLRGEIGLGEAYVDGLWETDDLVAVLQLGLLNRASVDLNRRWWARLTRTPYRLVHRLRRNTRAGSRRNIHAHYDLGNDFFRLFLDESLTYSCAVFASPDQSLREAQREKYRTICEAINLRPGDHVLEIGCGWAGFAEYAARVYGCRITGITISRAQLALARARIRAAGLEGAVDLHFNDYRDVTGVYDKIVCIEMIEAVGGRYLQTFFNVCDRVLAPSGRIGLQAITVPAAASGSQQAGGNWIQRYIFPGGELPSIATMEQAMHRTCLRIESLRDIGAHYPPTLRHWRACFHAASAAVQGLGFDQRFIRLWDYYLAACEAGFLARTISDVQIVMARAVPIADLQAGPPGSF